MKISESNIRKIIREEIENISTVDVFLDIDKGLDRCSRMRDLIQEFCNYTADDLKIDRSLVNISIVDNRDKSGVKTTAFYNPQDHRIAVYGKNRAIVDVCRSIAHELTHMHQMLDNRIKFPVQDVGGDIENEANARAGEIIKAFAQSSPKRQRIYESVKN